MPRPGGKGREKGGAVCRQKVGPFVNPLHLAAMMWENRERHVLPTNFRFLNQATNAGQNQRTARGLVPGEYDRQYEFFQFLRLLMNERPFLCHGIQLAPGHRGQTPTNRHAQEAAPHAQCNDVVFRLIQVNSADAPASVMYHHHWFWFDDEINDFAQATRNGSGRVRFEWPHSTTQAWTEALYGKLLFRPDKMATMSNPPDDTSDYWDKIVAAMSVYTRAHRQTAEQFVRQAEGVTDPNAVVNIQAVLRSVAVAAILYNTLERVHGHGASSGLSYKLPLGVARIRHRSIFNYFRKLYAADQWKVTQTADAHQFVPLPMLFTKKVRAGHPYAEVLKSDTDLPNDSRDWRRLRFHVHAANVAVSVCSAVPAVTNAAVTNTQKMELVSCAADGQWLLQAVKVRYQIGNGANGRWRSAAQHGQALTTALNTSPAANTVRVNWKKKEWTTQPIIVPNGCIGPNSHGFVCRNCGSVRRDVPSDAHAAADVPYHERQNCPCLLCSFHGNDQTSDLVDLRARHVMRNGPNRRRQSQAPKANRGLLTTFKNYFMNVPKFLPGADPANNVEHRNRSAVRGAFGVGMPWSKIYMLLNVKLKDRSNRNMVTGVFEFFASQKRFYDNQLKNLTIRQLSDAGGFAYIGLLELGVLQAAERQWRSSNAGQKEDVQKVYNELTRWRNPGQRRHRGRLPRLRGNTHAVRYDMDARAAEALAGGKANKRLNGSQYLLVVKPGCPFCERAIRLLDSVRAQLTVEPVKRRYPDADEALAKHGLKSTHPTFPIVFCDGQLVGGFDDLQKLHLTIRAGAKPANGASHSFILFASANSASKKAIRLLQPHGVELIEVKSPADVLQKMKGVRGSMGAMLRLSKAGASPPVPLAFTASGEYIGGIRHISRLYLDNPVYYGYASGHFTTDEKREVEYLLHNVLPRHAPWIKKLVAVDSTQQTPPDKLLIVFHKMKGSAIMKHLGTDDSSLQNLSVTQLFVPGQSPLRSDVYFNKKHWDNAPAHFDDEASYRCYLCTHETLHALGIAEHMEMSAYGPNEAESPANIMTQQTRSELAGVASPCKMPVQMLASTVPKSIATRVVGDGAESLAGGDGNDGFADDGSEDIDSRSPVGTPVSAGDVHDKIHSLHRKEQSFSGQ